MICKDNEPIMRQKDGNYKIKVNGCDYGVCDNSQAEQYKISDVEAYLAEHPEALIPEPLPPEPMAEQKEAAARMQRNALLTASDWTQLPDAPGKVDRIAWAAYRQKLRDITNQAGWPLNIVWPVAPA